MKRILAFIAAVTFLVSCNNNTTTKFGTKLVEEVKKKGDEIVIPYQKYVLPNGLTLLVHEDHSDPIVHVDVTYHVGSSREELGRSGFAHFFEHMMFQGSDHVADEQHFKIVSEAGGELNGTTNSDRTNYFETLPSNQLETALWLEADRMGFLLDAVTTAKFENQRATVKNERGQSYDNRPYGLIGEKVAQAMYPQGHPYSWPVIGYLAELDRATLDDLKHFFLRWYGPNNATLTVAGDVDPKQVVELVEKYYGPIPAGPEVKPMTVEKTTLAEDRYISYEDNIRFPLIQFAYPTVGNRHPDEAPLDILADIMGGGKNSIFYENFEKPQLAVQANVAHPCMELAGQFQLTVLPFPGKTLAEMEGVIRKSIDEFETREINDDDLNRTKAMIENQLIQQLASVDGKASLLASYQTFTGNPNYIQAELKRYADVTKEDVKRVFNTYIKGQKAVVLSVYPKGQKELAAKEDNYTPKFVDSTFVPDDSEYKGLVYNKAKDPEGFDRSKQPAAGPNPSIKVPDYWTENFDNGLAAIGAKNDEVPTVALRISIRAGHRFEDAAKSGIASLTADLLGESTQNYTGEEIANKLEVLGSNIDIYAGNEEIVISVSSLKKNLDKTLELVEEKLMKPKFSMEDFNRLKQQQMEGIANQATQPTVIADNNFKEAIYGKGHIMSIPSVGTIETVASITLDDVKAYYESKFSPSISKLVVVGDVEKDEVLGKLGFLKSWAKKDVQFAEEKPTPAIEKTKIILVNKPQAPQSEIRIGYIAMPFDATGDFYKSKLMNFPLGAAFNSRVNLNLREDKGWTYGARSGFQGSKFAGAFVAAAGVKATTTDSSVVEFMKEINNYAANGITEQELAFTKSSIGQSDARKYETSQDKAQFLQQILDYSLDKNFVDEQNKILANITKAEIDALAKSKLPADKMVMVIVGDKDLVYPGLSKLGYEIEVRNMALDMVKK
jgi:zinc protease